MRVAGVTLNICRMNSLLLAVGIISGLQRTSAGDSSAATELLCKIQEFTSDLNPDPSAYARIKDIHQEEIADKDEEAISCVLKNHNDLKIGSALLEIVVEDNPPATLFLEVANLHLPELLSSTLECSYGDIGPNNRIGNFLQNEFESIGEDWTYHCGEAEHILKLVFAGVYRKKPTASNDREKRSLSKGSKVPCVTFSKKSPGYHPLKEDEGHLCKITKHEHGRFMHNEAGDLGCFLCCRQHHWFKPELQCKKCPECTTREDENIWTSCNPIPCKVPSETSTLEPEQVTVATIPTSSTSKGPDAKESMGTSTEASHVEEIKHPEDAPTELSVDEVSTSHAYIMWKSIPSTATRPVTHYRIWLKKFEPEVENFFDTKDDAPYFNLTSLRTHSCYNVKVQAVNSEGRGPFSANLELHIPFGVDTPLGLPPVNSINVSNDGKHVKLTWSPITSHSNMLVEAHVYSLKLIEFPMSPIIAPGVAGNCTFVLPQTGSYIIRLCYMKNLQSGPMSKHFTVNYPDTTNPSTIAAVICGVLLFICIIGFVYYCKFRRSGSSGGVPDPKQLL